MDHKKIYFKNKLKINFKLQQIATNYMMKTWHLLIETQVGDLNF